MPNFVSIRADGDKGSVVTVTEAFAKNIGAEILDDEPAVDKLGRPLEPRELGAYENPPEPSFGPAIALPETSGDAGGQVPSPSFEALGDHTHLSGPNADDA